MLPYILSFSLCILFTYIAGNKKVKIGDKCIPNFIFSVFAILIPCFLAAIRDSRIGTDVLVYGDKLFELATKYDNLLVYLSHIDFEKLYGTITFVIAHLFNRYVYYFVLQFLVIFPIYCFLFDKNTKKYAWVGIMIYLFWFYPFSLNIMRQSIAVAILLWNYKNIRDKKTFKYLFWCFIAFGFHKTAIIGLLIYLINILTTYEYKSDSLQNRLNPSLKLFKNFNKLLIVFCTVIFVFLGVKIIEIAISMTGLYSDQLSFKTNSGCDIVNLFLMTVIICMSLKYKKENKDISYWLLLILIGSILYQLKMSLSQMYRISIYFTSYIILIFPMILNTIKEKSKRVFMIFIILLLSMINFWYYIVYRGWHDVYPYISYCNSLVLNK